MSSAQPQKAFDLRIAAYVLISLIAIPVGGYLGWKKYDDTEREAVIWAKRSVVARGLKDPDSTQYRNEKLSFDEWLCGELNSKNGFGAYVGYKRFYVRDASFSQLEGFPPMGTDGAVLPVSADDRIAQINEEIRFMQENGRQRTAAETLAEQFRSNQQEFDANWAKHCT